jgi:rhodanese-related sulfurtransferase
MGLLSLFTGKKKKIEAMLAQGAVVVDVRTAGEYKSGHAKGSKNMPLQTISNKTKELQKMKKPIIFCCASGMRSGQATSIMKSKGIECMNGGSWSSVARYV